MASSALRRAFQPLLLMAPSLLLLGTIFIVPLFIMLSNSFYTNAPDTALAPDLTLDNYKRLFFDDLYYRVFWGSVKLGLTVTAWCLVLGFPLAYSLARMRSNRGRSLVIVLLLCPLMTSAVVRSYGWLIMLGDQGVLSVGLMNLGLIESPMRLLYTQAGTTIALVEVLLPFMVLSLLGVIQNIQPSLEEAAASLGAGAWRVLVDVVLPLSMPGIAAGSVLVFILAIGAFVTPALIGGAKILFVPMLVYQQAMGVLNWPFAAAIAFVFLLLVMMLIRVQVYLLDRHRRWSGNP